MTVDTTRHCRYMAGLIALSLTLSGCWRFDPLETAHMLEPEKTSYMAVGRYLTCLNAHVKSAQAGHKLSDAEVEKLGYRCKKELREAAIKRDRYWSSEGRVKEGDILFYAPTRVERIALQERDLASTAWCELRECLTVD
ncbi:hypothetical protein [Sphingomonas sp. Leaf62]|uniref:hypothetical protein n=1 Tax=Sphingomonas sp. Leaf62 TaxID=1736228 RepID=UPI0012E23A03|nr:hypothetical protein [Sphingomonas sp. Leaf62]